MSTTSNFLKSDHSTGFPDFIVIGAMKAGTTSLQHYLSSHPDIAMAPKSLSFFCDGINWDRGVDWYQKHFHSPDKIQGEISPSYSKGHVFDDVPGKIHSYIPGVKIIYVVREPVSRIVSHFSHAIGADTEGRSAEKILEDSIDHFVNTSRYGAQLERYLRYFDIGDIHIVTAEKLREDRKNALSGIFGFIGANNSFSSDAFSQTRHDSSIKVKRNAFGRVIARYPVFQRVESVAKTIVPHKLYPAFGRALGKSFEKPLLSAEIRAEIDEALRDDVRRLQVLTGYDFEEWQRKRP